MYSDDLLVFVLNCLSICLSLSLNIYIYIYMYMSVCSHGNYKMDHLRRDDRVRINNMISALTAQRPVGNSNNSSKSNHYHGLSRIITGH